MKFKLIGSILLILSFALTGCNSVFRSASSTAIAAEENLESPTPLPTSTLQATLTPALPTVTPTPTQPVCMEIRGRIEYREIVSGYQKHPLGMRVYLPPCYGSEGDRFYPVLYILHGQSYNDDQWDRLGIDEIADRMISAGEAPPFIIVMPRENNYLEDDKISAYGQAVAESLVSWIDKEYATCAVRECRALGGISRGAAWAMRIGFEYWQIFGAIGTHSFAPFPGDFYNSPYWISAILEGQTPRIYMDIGATDGLLEPANLFEQRLTDYAVPHEWVINAGTHNEEYWESQVENYLYWYTFPWHSMDMHNDKPEVFSITPTAPVPESE